jgi:hypothetical protein
MEKKDIKRITYRPPNTISIMSPNFCHKRDLLQLKSALPHCIKIKDIINMHENCREKKLHNKNLKIAMILLVPVKPK